MSARPKLNGGTPARLDSPSDSTVLSIIRDVGATIAVARNFRKLSGAARNLLYRAETAARERPTPVLIAAFGLGCLAMMLLLKKPPRQ